MVKEKDGKSTAKRKRKPAATPEAREKQLISLAYDLAEERFINGTATSAEVVHFLKQGSMKAQYEIEKLRKENEFLKAKTEALASAKVAEEIYVNALEAMKIYGGSSKQQEE